MVIPISILINLNEIKKPRGGWASACERERESEGERGGGGESQYGRETESQRKRGREGERLLCV